MNNSFFLKKLVVFFTELVVVFLMVLNIIPRDFGLFLTGLLIFYFIFSPLVDSLWIFIASIPLFIALPISQDFDSMANWRILLSVLFLVMIFRQGISIKSIRDFIEKYRFKKNLNFCQIECLSCIFLAIGGLSLFVASDFIIGFKKLLFLINIFLLYIIIKKLIAKNKKVVFTIINASKTAIGLVLVVGFIQLLSTFFVSLHLFWKFWARYVISVFYGNDLSQLLSYSNTWFSYHSYQPSTLRIFSIFPDSHSFAFFCILSLSFFLTIIFWRPKISKKKLFVFYFLLSACLLNIIFSGSRGSWVSAFCSLILFLFIILFFYSPTIRSFTDFFIPKYPKKYWKQIQLILGCIIIFFLLFPISSSVLLFSQRAQFDKFDPNNFSLFERARSIIDFSEKSVKSRLQIWQKTGESIIRNPVLGVGIGNYPKVLNEDISSVKRGASAHNLYLDVASEMGIFALLVLLAIFWLIFKDAWYIFTKVKPSFLQVWSGFFILALFWILGYSLFDVVLLNDKVLLFFIVNLGILYAAKISIGFNKSSRL
ncbi:MAG: O-antigen ligase family protein [bacterium]